jgi:hypothetical protein
LVNKNTVASRRRRETPSSNLTKQWRWRRGGPLDQGDLVFDCGTDIDVAESGEAHQVAKQAADLHLELFRADTVAVGALQLSRSQHDRSRDEIRPMNPPVRTTRGGTLDLFHQAVEIA